MYLKSEVLFITLIDGLLGRKQIAQHGID